MSYNRLCLVDFGIANSGLTSVGYQLYDIDGNVYGPVVSGIPERGVGIGIYGTGISFDDDWTGEIQWCTNTDYPIYASEDINNQAAVSINAALSALETHGDSIWATADISGLATSDELSDVKEVATKLQTMIETV